jgi:hypothetical protein
VLTVALVPVVLKLSAPLPLSPPETVKAAAVLPEWEMTPPPVPTATLRLGPRSMAVVPL